MNILATLHPKDKDYGHMKIEEPKTPFAQYVDGDSGDEHDGIDADLLAKKIQLGGNELPKALIEPEESEESEDEDISPEEREKRKIFEMKRKQHYNEFYAVKLARKLMQNDDVDDDDDDELKEEDETESKEEKDSKMEEVDEDGKKTLANPGENMAIGEEEASGD
ncbi:protein phosphatase inhibitor 2 isoform X2 [Procambarus clarkii]